MQVFGSASEHRDVCPRGGLVHMKIGGLVREEGETELDRRVICQHGLWPTALSNVPVQRLSPGTLSKSNSPIERLSFGSKCEKTCETSTYGCYIDTASFHNCFRGQPTLT